MQVTEVPEVGRRTTRRQRLSLAAILIFVALQMLLFLYLVTIGWQFRTLMLTPGDPEIMVRTRTAFANGIWFGANVAAVAVFLLRRRGIGRNVLLGVLAFDLLNSVFAAFGFLVRDDSTNAVAWLLAGMLPLVALLLLWHQPSERFGAQQPQSAGGR